MHGIGDPHHPQGLVLLMDSENGRIGEVLHPCFTGFVILGNLQIQNHRIFRTGPFSVAEEVTQRVSNEGSPLPIQLHLLDKVGVGADDGVHAVIQQEIFNGLLGGADLVVVLTAPVDQGNGNIGLILRHGLQHALDAVGIHLLIGRIVVFVEHIDAVLTAGRQTHGVHTLGKGHDGNLNAAHIPDGIATGTAELVPAAESAYALQSGGLNGIQRCGKTCHAVVNGVGIGHLDQIHAGTLQRHQHALGHRLVSTAVGSADHIALQIHHRQITGRQQRQNVHKGRAIVLALTAGGHHIVGDVQVTCRQQMDHGLARFLGFLSEHGALGFRRLGRGLGIVRTVRFRLSHRRFCGGALGLGSGQDNNGNDRHTDHQHHCHNDQLQHQSLLLFAALLLQLLPPGTAPIQFFIFHRHNAPPSWQNFVSLHYTPYSLHSQALM